MRFTKNQKIAMGAVGSLMVIIILGIVYAAFTQQLSINGSATGRSSSWRVYFSSLSNVSLTGTAKELTAPQIDSNNQTSIGNYSVTVTSPGDSVEYTFDVTNSGDYDATLSGLTKTNPSCTGTGDNASTDATNVCGKLTYTLKYADGTTVAQNDTLASKETKTMNLKLTYNTFDDASLLPKADVTINGLGITLTYSQDGNAKVNNDGSTPLITYSHHVGDTFTLNGDGYHIITDSLTTDDYVVALKDVPLTVSEINFYGTGHLNRYTIESQNVANDVIGDGSVGGMAYYSSDTCSQGDKSNCKNSYAESDIKYIVDAWAVAKFTDELKTVDGYNARLITFSELTNNIGYIEQDAPWGGKWYPSDNSIPNWVYSRKYEYWTMTPSSSVSAHIVASSLGGQDVWRVNPGVRPVINVRKSAIQ